MSTTKMYYHAGAAEESTVWSNHTRKTYEAAAKEASKLARRHGGRAVVEYWGTNHGLRPRCADVIIGADFV